MPRATIKDTEFGFEKFRGAAATGGGGVSGDGKGVVLRDEETTAIAPSGLSLESLDPGMRSRVEAALKVLKESKKKHKTKKKRKKERKDKDFSKHRKKRGREKKKKKKKKKKYSTSDSGSSSGSSSSSSSESDA